MAEQTKVTTLEKVVIRFSGDSGDGMQLTGTIFSNLSAIFGNEISTFPDYPAEVRAPQGTLSGVSGFQVHLGSRKIFTPGDKADVLVAMNPAALKVNVKNLKDYLGCSKIVCCGGSWMVKNTMIENNEFDRIEELVKEAVEIVKESRT